MGNSTAKDHIVDLAGRRLHYRQWGPPLARPIVLVHGYPGHTHVWDIFAEMMRMSRDYRVIAVDLSGHGESDWAETYSFAQWDSDLHAMALALGLPRFTMIGHSLGATIGFCFADAHPSMLDHLIAVDGLPLGSWEPTTPNAGALPRSFSNIEECAAFLGIDLTTLPADSISGTPSYLVKPDGRGGFVWRHDLDGAVGVVGWIGARPEYGGRVWELHPLVVRASHRRRGIGRTLVLDVERRVRERGGLTLWVGTDDEDGRTTLAGHTLYPDVLGHLAGIRNLHDHPYAFYQKLGFVIVGVVPDANGPGKPDILLAKAVDG